MDMMIKSAAFEAGLITFSELTGEKDLPQLRAFELGARFGETREWEGKERTDLLRREANARAYTKDEEEKVKKLSEFIAMLASDEATREKFSEAFDEMIEMIEVVNALRRRENIFGGARL